MKQKKKKRTNKQKEMIEIENEQKKKPGFSTRMNKKHTVYTKKEKKRNGGFVFWQKVSRKTQGILLVAE